MDEREFRRFGLENFDSVALSYIPKEPQELSPTERSRHTARTILAYSPEKLVRAEIEMRTVLDPLSILVYAIGTGKVEPMGREIQGLFYITELKKNSDPTYIPLSHIKSFTPLFNK